MSEAVAILPTHPISAIVGRKLRSLDGLRGIAILLVFLCHLAADRPAPNYFMALTRAYLTIGWIGVDLFFVLSGFLITGILLDTREAKNYFSGFYSRRILRIFPLYYVTLTAIVVASQILTNTHAQCAPKIASLVPLPEDRWVYFCYLTNWIGLWKQQWGPDFGSILAHFWSLAIEEQFYFIWPLIVWIARPRAIPRIAIGMAAAAAIIRLIWLLHSGPQVAIALATVTRMDSLFMGALCASLYRNPQVMQKVKGWLPWVAWAGVGSFMLGYTILLLFPSQMAQLIYGSPRVHRLGDETAMMAQGGGYTLLALGFGAIVLLSAYSDGKPTWVQKILGSGFLGTLGMYSYGIYVFHVPILVLLGTYVYNPLMQRNGVGAWIVAYVAGATLITFLVSALSYELFERKILRYKRFFEPRVAPQPPVALATPESLALDGE